MSYDAFASTFSESRKNLRWGEIEYFMEYIERRFPERKISILDVGCGNGRFLETLETSGLLYSYLGIDESAWMVHEAKKLHLNQTFKVLDMIHIDELSSQEKCDVIVFIASFHHLQTEQERIEVLQKTKRLLAPDGIIMMTNWNLLGEELFVKYEKSYKWKGDFEIKIGSHIRYYHGFTTEELEILFEDAGYSIWENRVFEGGKNIVSIIAA